MTSFFSGIQTTLTVKLQHSNSVPFHKEFRLYALRLFNQATPLSCILITRPPYTILTTFQSTWEFWLPVGLALLSETTKTTMRQPSIPSLLKTESSSTLTTWPNLNPWLIRQSRDMSLHNSSPYVTGLRKKHSYKRCQISNARQSPVCFEMSSEWAMQRRSTLLYHCQWNESETALGVHKANASHSAWSTYTYQGTRVYMKRPLACGRLDYVIQTILSENHFELM